MENKTTVEITLTRANAGSAEYVASVLKLPVREVISLCLKGSTNPKAKKTLRIKKRFF